MKQSIWWVGKFVGTVDIPEEAGTLGRSRPDGTPSWISQFISAHARGEEFTGERFVSWLLERCPGATRLPDDPDAGYDESWWVCGHDWKPPAQFADEYARKLKEKRK